MSLTLKKQEENDKPPDWLNDSEEEEEKRSPPGSPLWASNETPFQDEDEEQESQKLSHQVNFKYSTGELSDDNENNINAAADNDDEFDSENSEEAAAIQPELYSDEFDDVCSSFFSACFHC